MNKLIKSLLVTALAVSASHIQAKTSTNKTTLNPRSHGVNLALENTAGWYDLIHRKNEDKFGGNFQAAFFYSASTNKKELGQYFGVVNKADFTAGESTGNQANTADLDELFFLHDQAFAVMANQPFAETAKISLRPEQRAIGVYFNYHQDFCKILDGLYFRVNLPVVNVENEMGLNITNADAKNVQVWQQFLSGVVPTADNVDRSATGVSRQAALTNALIDGKKHDKTGVADIDVILGYDFLAKEEYHASINIGVSIPTGQKNEGKFVFEPTIGATEHVGFGAGLDAGVCFWGDDNNGGLRVHGALNYRYLFEGREKRTLGIKGITETTGGWNQYVGLLKRGTQLSQQSITPAANVTTLNVDVTPGSQIDAIIALGYGMWGLTFDVGYNVFYREDESVKLKDAFADNVWAVAAPTADMTQNTVAQIGTANTVTTAVNAADLDLNAAANPSTVTHKIYAGIGWVAKDWDVPLLIGVGGHYEFSDNSGIENWGVNAKLGVSF